MDISSLFHEKPEAWGLRGDPALWDEMQASLRGVPLPSNRAALDVLLRHCFEQHAGTPITSESEHEVPRFDSGGMSGGHVLPTYWRSHLIPLLLDRAESARAAYAKQVRDLLDQAKQLARDYRALTGKPLGITGEVAEFAAAEALGLTLAGAREAGYDAVRHEGERDVRIQIKGRCLTEGAKRGQRVGGIKLDQPWDTVILVILDELFEPLVMYEADRGAVQAALEAPGSRARNERGALSVQKFRAIARTVWSRPGAKVAPAHKPQLG